MGSIPTGIPGLDELLDGGLLDGSVTLVRGLAGTGKTILCTQFVHNGATEYSDPGVFITLEEGAKNIWWNMQNFKWDLTKLQRQGLVKIYRIGKIVDGGFVLDLDDELAKLEKILSEMRAHRVTIDSLSDLQFYYSSPVETKRAVFKLIASLKEMDCTALVTSDVEDRRFVDTDITSTVGVESFLTDGIITLDNEHAQRSLRVEKMRGVPHDRDPHPFDVTPSGMVVNPREKTLWKMKD
jgi:KaiC/GvpD/RAD55 family RecA-like ATPase